MKLWSVLELMKLLIVNGGVIKHYLSPVTVRRPANQVTYRQQRWGDEAFLVTYGL